MHSRSIKLNMSMLAGQTDCSSPDDSPGNCINYRYCDFIIRLVVQNYQQKDAGVDNYLRSSVCGYDNVDPMVTRHS